MYSPCNQIIVTVDELFKDKKGSLYIDTTFNLQEHVTYCGTVVSPPAKVSKDYREMGIHNTVLAGDKLYFNYTTCLDPENLMIVDGVQYWRVDYYNAFCAVRNGEIIMLGEHVFLKPIRTRVEKIGLIIVPEIAQDKEENIAEFVYGNNVDVPRGTHVYFDPIGKFENEIEGEKYYVMYSENIWAIK